jgi:hypothetical protein
MTSVILALGLAASMFAQTTIAQPGTSYPLDTFTEFSAVTIGSRAEPGEGATEGRICRSGKSMRMEDPGRRGYYITDVAAGETYGISEAGRFIQPTSREQPFKGRALPGASPSHKKPAPQ